MENQFSFHVDKVNKSIHVQRVFDANLKVIWNAWTKADILDQWWAPKPYRNQTKTFDFKEGGTWMYAMISPENEVHFGRFDYTRIEPFKEIAGFDAFCDENGKVNTEFPKAFWEYTFSDSADKTLVKISLTFDTLDELNSILEMGFKEGFEMGLQNLNDLVKPG